MDRYIQKILEKNISDIEKHKELNALLEDIKFAKEAIDHMTYCPKCHDYYLTESFIDRCEEREINVLTYEDPINSGGNEYKLKRLVCHIKICPKGHETILNTQSGL